MDDRRPTMRDVAQRSGVSSQTVSRVINGDVHVSTRTRNRVLKAIDDLNFHPNRAAQSLVTNRSRVLEVITFGTTYYGPAQMVARVEIEAKTLGYNLIVSSVDNLSLEQIRAAVDNLRGRLVDGIIMITPIAGASYQDIADLCRGIPSIWIDSEHGVEVPSVIIDQQWGGHLVAHHLLGLGHRQICEISGPLNWNDAIARSRGSRATMEAADVEPGVTVEADWTAEGGYAAVSRLIEMDTSFTALIVGNDQMALGVIHSLNDHGLRVPEDVSVVGFDDIPEAAHFHPPLTTVRQDFGALGKQSVEYLVALVRNPQLAVHQRILRPRMVVRQSTQHIT